MDTFIKKTLLFILLAWCVPVFAFAAEIRLDAHKVNVVQNEQFVVDIVVNSAESLNAIEGRLVFPPEMLVVTDIFDGNSIINFWIEKSRLVEPGVIAFSGITPGGFSGTNNKIVSVVFEAKHSGDVSLTLQKVIALKNDGLGSKAILDSRAVQISIGQGDSVSRKEIIIDTDIPEDFNPTIESDPAIFAGKYFLVFGTQDKGSGIDHYVVREGQWGWYRNAESPYLLKHQQRDKKIYVKAIDRNGNERVATIEPQTNVSWWEQYSIVGILILIASLFLIKILWSKFTLLEK